MKNESKILTEDEAAKNEPPVSADELLKEIMPLLQDYFEGELSFCNGGITYCLPNGQKFMLKAELIA